MKYYKIAAKGNQFVLTQKGYEATPDHVKPERVVGKPVMPIYTTYVPYSWHINGWVEEREV